MPLTRLKARVVAARALGFKFTRDGLAKVSQPMRDARASTAPNFTTPRTAR